MTYIDYGWGAKSLSYQLLKQGHAINLEHCKLTSDYMHSLLGLHLVGFITDGEFAKARTRINKHIIEKCIVP
jgi:hypothetical protein